MFDPQKDNSKEAPRSAPELPPVPRNLESVKQSYAITVRGKVQDTFSPLLENGQFEIPAYRTAGQFLLLAPANSPATVLRLKALLASSSKKFRSQTDEQTFRELLSSPERLSRLQVIEGHVLDRWGLASVAAIVSGFASRVERERPRELLLLTSTSQENAGHLDKFKYVGMERIPSQVLLGMNVGGFFSSSVRELKRIVQALTPLSEHLHHQKIAIVSNERTLSTGALISLNPAQLNVKELKGIEQSLLQLLKEQKR